MEPSTHKTINPWLHIWCYPRTTIQRILEANPKKYILWFAIIMGALDGFIGTVISQQGAEGIRNHSALFILATIVGGIILGIVQLYVISWLLRVTGSWVRGKGDYTSVKCALGWSYYPMIIVHLVFIIDLFTGGHPFVDIALSIIHFVLTVWAIVILLHVIGQAHKFSVWRSLGAIVIAMLIIAVIALIIALLIPLVSPLFVS